MNKSMKLALRAITLLALLASIDTQSMDEANKQKKTRFEQSKEAALWRMGGMLLGGLVLGGITYIATDNLSKTTDCTNRAQTQYQVFKAAALITSISAGALIGEAAAYIPYKNENQLKKEMYLWRLGGMAAGATALLAATYLSEPREINVSVKIPKESYDTGSCYPY